MHYQWLSQAYISLPYIAYPISYTLYRIPKKFQNFKILFVLKTRMGRDAAGVESNTDFQYNTGEYNIYWILHVKICITPISYTLYRIPKKFQNFKILQNFNKISKKFLNLIFFHKIHVLSKIVTRDVSQSEKDIIWSHIIILLKGILKLVLTYIFTTRDNGCYRRSTNGYSSGTRCTCYWKLELK
jgi:hypothetical protein